MCYFYVKTEDQILQNLVTFFKVISFIDRRNIFYTTFGYNTTRIVLEKRYFSWNVVLPSWSSFYSLPYICGLEFILSVFLCCAACRWPIFRSKNVVLSDDLLWRFEFWMTYFYNESQRNALINLFDKVLYMFRTGPLSIIRSISTLYTQKYVFVMLVLLAPGISLVSL